VSNPTTNLRIVQPPPPAMATLGRALELLLGQTRQRVVDGVRSAATLGMQESHARWLEARLGADYELELLTGLRLIELSEAWRARGREDGRPLTLSTLAKRLTTLRRAVRLAVQRGELDDMPIFPEIGLPPWRARQHVLCTYDQLLKLLSVLPVRRRDWVSVAVWSCQRPGDVERMRWQDVNLDADPPWMFVRSTKTRKPDGIKVKMPQPMRDVLCRLRERLYKEGRKPAATDLLIDRWPGVSRTLPVVCVRNGLPPMSAIDLRHTGISWMVRRIGLTRAAQEWGGWSDYNMMSKHYAHALPAGLAQASDELASIVDEKPPENDTGKGGKGKKRK